MVKIAKIHGGPGCGKTTFLTQQLRRDCEHTRPDHIGAFSLTNAAVNTIKDRVFADFNYTADSWRYFGTEHSNCTKLLGKPKVAKPEQFSKDMPEYALSKGQSREDYSADMSVNDELYNQMNIYRHHMIPENQWEPDVLNFWNVWKHWCEDTGVIDFTMMFENVLLRQLVPDDLKIIYVDEVQDHTKLAMEVLKLWSKYAEKLVIIGDSDQALYRFSGAEPEMLIDYPCDYETNLKQTYRLPENIRQFAMDIIKKCHYRADVEYKSIKDGGQVDYVLGPDLSLPGSHMIVVRFKAKLKFWIDSLKRKKLLWHNPNKPKDLWLNPTKTNEWKAIKVYHKLVTGFDPQTPLTWQEILDLSECLKVATTMKRGTKKKLQDALKSSKDTGECRPKATVDPRFDLIPFGFFESFICDELTPEECLNLKTEAGKMALGYLKTNPDKLYEKPKIKVGTIHSVKGDEADNVWIDRALTKRIRRSMSRNQQFYDDELRCMYVAATRAKERLGIIKSDDVNPFI